jgi:metal-responsive CopG/Arc/MetJ family transcriptional regulator
MEATMPISTVNFSVPEEIKQAFNEAFASENKSAIIARLMQQAVEERRRLRQRASAIDALLAQRRTQRPASEAEVTQARDEGRP